jgi:hypothetical protein
VELKSLCCSCTRVSSIVCKWFADEHSAHAKKYKGKKKKNRRKKFIFIVFRNGSSRLWRGEGMKSAF